MSDERRLPERPYGAFNPVPKVAYLFQNIVDPRGATKKKAQRASGERDEQKRQTHETQKLVSDMQRGKEMDVHDPITKGSVTIKNADEDIHDQTEVEKAGGENVLSMDLPEPDWEDYFRASQAISTRALALTAASYVVIPILLSFIPLPYLSPESFIYRPLHLLLSLILPSLLAYTFLFQAHRLMANNLDERRWHSERLRGEMAGQDKDGDGKISSEERVKESAEWLNAALAQIIPILNPDIFSYLIDMLEDVMQASVPGIVHSVRISDMGLGITPLRIVSIRSLPDAEGAAEQETEDERGTHINLEFSFAYRAAPSGSDVQSKAQNAHLLVEFFLGLKGLAGVAMPVWVEIRGVIGTGRARLQLDGNPPFAKDCTVTLLGLPQIDIAATPMSQKFANVMNLPVISTFIENSINTAVAEYVAPKHLVLNLKQLLSGDDIKKDTMAVGVVIIHIHRAKNIKGSDGNGKSDPYVTVCYSRLSKPLYSTRIILGELNPVFQETAYIPIDASLIKIQESIQLQLWDSDRSSADDVLGTVEMDITEMIRHRGKAFRRCMALQGTDKGTKMPGELEFTVGFYGKVPPTTALKTDGADPGIPEDLKDKPEFKEARATALSDLEAAVLVTPPDPAYPSGLLSVQIHEVTDLGINNTKGSLKGGKRMGQQGAEPDVVREEEGTHFPSSYCNILINDKRVYKTRVKPISGIANFNAGEIRRLPGPLHASEWLIPAQGTEKFISNWRTSHVTVVVRDSRNRENDPIIGLVFLKLSDIFVNASEVTRVYPLERGIGYGNVRLSILFRPIEAKLSSNLLGFDIGLLHLKSVKVVEVDAKVTDELGSCKLKIGTPSSTQKVDSDVAEEEDDSVEWEPDQPLLLPLERRYSEAMVVKFKSTGITSSTIGTAVLWLRDLIDNDDKPVRVGIWRAENYARVEQNYISADGLEETDSLSNDENEEGRTRIGTLEIHVVFKPGLTEEHTKTRDTSDAHAREEQEALDRMDSGGLRDHLDDEPIPDLVSVKSSEDNTSVYPGETEYVGRQNQAPDSDAEEEADDSKSLKDKFKDWRASQHSLHAQHRGVMQKKPARTTKWIKDTIKQEGHNVAQRFRMTERQPDVETEV
ncbi:hypothetical protein CALCODRAFT_557073 [Calocera cornea HHB12733]|uniref:C2 domain-containing protein n=1 Tax=Calocera cornea HHB12733 TaxID=1353952 RepID=A0A165E7M9_9BASI|nr:hypothetical protein CALCODRAFT_557073 [Calocera cornea HHB12733]